MGYFSASPVTAALPNHRDTLVRFHHSQSSSRNVTEQQGNSASHFKPVQILEPVTPLGKIGLSFAKVGIFFSGIAGIFNGIALRFPLMPLGESLVVASSPVIHKPVGMGLYHMGLSSIFAARAVENDPWRKLNVEELRHQAGIGEKARYLFKNIGSVVKEVVHSGNKVYQNLFGLFGPNRKQAIGFFRHSIFSTRPKVILVNEVLNAKGKSFIQFAMKPTPYLMHMATTILALGGFVLTMGSLLHQKWVEKIGFRGAALGASLDNLSMAKHGFEKFAFGDKVSGPLMTLCGLIIFPGQQYMDRNWGRGLMWIGTGLLFAVFGVDRFKGVLAGRRLQKTPLWQEATQLIRRWEIDPILLLKQRRYKDVVQLNKTIAAFSQVDKDPTVFLKELQVLKNTQPQLAHLLESMLQAINGKPYQENSQQVLKQVIARLQSPSNIIPSGLTLKLSAVVGKPADMRASIRQINQRLFGSDLSSKH